MTRLRRHTRHATLLATLDWSWELLSGDEQAALARLSVFEGGFTLAAAEAVLVGADSWSVDTVQALVDKSLVRAVADDRLDLLVSVQEYAAARLAEHGAVAEAEASHGAWFAANGPGFDRARALRELDNLAVAARRAAARGDGATAVSTLETAAGVLLRRGPFADAQALAAQVAATPGLDGRERARVDLVWGRALQATGRVTDARPRLEAALEGHRSTGDRRAEARILEHLGRLGEQTGRREEARTTLDAALALHRDAGGDGLGEAQILSAQGDVLRELGRPHEAAAAYEAALALVREAGDRALEAPVRHNLGILCASLARMDEARAQFEAALASAREAGDRRTEGVALSNLGNLSRDTGRADLARTYYEAALALAREVGMRRSEGVVLGNLGIVHFTQGRPTDAHAHYEAALLVHRECGNRPFEGIVLGALALLEASLGRHDEAAATYRAALAVHREVGNRRFEGIALGNLGLLLADTGRPDEARAHCEAALVVHREVGNRRFEAIVLGALAALALHRETRNPVFEGSVLGSLGLLYARAGRTGEARRCFDDARHVLRTIEDPVGLGKVLAMQAEAEHLAGSSEAALAALAEAVEIARAQGQEATSELGRALDRVRSIVR